jgi:Ni/Fe-hydrogenase subunit HybB-like protein
MERRRIPIGTIILVILMVIGLVVGVIRLVQGLGRTTNLSDDYPWGLWIGFDMISGVAFSSGAFTLAAIVYIFNLKKYQPVVRSAILTGFIGYLIAILGLAADLGRPFRIFNLIFHWNVHSVLFEVGWCVMLYTAVMALELLPMIFERFDKPGPLRVLRTIQMPLVIAGVTLSTMHQNSLGALFLALPGSLHPLWYSPILPVFFYVSAIGLGLATEIFESSIISRAYKKKPHLEIMSGLARAIPYVLGLYLLLKLGDLILAGDFMLMFDGSLLSIMFLAEMVIGVILPIILFSLPKVRQNPSGLFWGATSIVVGIILNRLNVSILAPQLLTEPGHIPQATYFPAWTEFAFTIGLISLGLLLYMLAVRFLPVFKEEGAGAH